MTGFEGAEKTGSPLEVERARAQSEKDDDLNFQNIPITIPTEIARLTSRPPRSQTGVGPALTGRTATNAAPILAEATLCFFGRSREVAVASVACLSTNFLIYRTGLWWIGWKQPCGCMGSLTDALHIKAQTADHIALGLLLYMLAASCGVLFVEWWRTRSNLGNPDRPAMKENETAGKER